MVKDWGWGAIKEKKNLQIKAHKGKQISPPNLYIKKRIKRQTFQDLFGGKKKS